jgi:hypothetical protein
MMVVSHYELYQMNLVFFGKHIVTCISPNVIKQALSEKKYGLDLI